ELQSKSAILPRDSSRTLSSDSISSTASTGKHKAKVPSKKVPSSSSGPDDSSSSSSSNESEAHSKTPKPAKMDVSSSPSSSEPDTSSPDNKAKSKKATLTESTKAKVAEKPKTGFGRSDGVEQITKKRRIDINGSSIVTATKPHTEKTKR